MFDTSHLTHTDWQGVAALIYIIVVTVLAIYRLTLGGIYKLSFLGWRKIILWPLYVLEVLISWALGGK